MKGIWKAADEARATAEAVHAAARAATADMVGRSYDAFAGDGVDTRGGEGSRMYYELHDAMSKIGGALRFRDAVCTPGEGASAAAAAAEYASALSEAADALVPVEAWAREGGHERVAALAAGALAAARDILAEL